MSQVQESEYEMASPARCHFEMKENECYGDLKIAPQNKAATKDTKKSTARSGSKRVMIASTVIIMLIVVLTLVVAAACTVFALEISSLKTGTASTQQEHRSTSADLASKLEGLNSLLEGLNQKWDSQLQQLNLSFNSDLNGLANQTQQINDSLPAHGNTIRNEISMEIQILRDNLQGGLRLQTIPASSCAALPPSSPSGYYWVRASNGSAVRVYCDVTRSCGGVTGGWMRVAELDMTNSSHQCPSGLMERTFPAEQMEPRTCVSTNTSANSCSHTFFNISRISYSKVCGKIIGYQIQSTNGFINRRLGIDSVYVDGVSLTHGSPRQHIWTFAAARDTSSDNRCPGAGSPPSYVGTNYFCDTGVDTTNNARQDVLFASHPLWDCEEESMSCDSSSPPWFYKQLPQLATDNIEMRVCRDEAARYEDVAIETIEIYVQ